MMVIQGPETGMKLVEVKLGHARMPWRLSPHLSHACKNMQGGFEHGSPSLNLKQYFLPGGVGLRWFWLLW